MTIIITLSFAGNETGPFDLYSDATGFAIPFAQNVSKAALLAGYQVEAPDGTTVVRLDNLNSSCGSIDIYSCATPNCDFTGSIICDVTTTTTTSSSSTTTTSTTYFPDPSGVPCLWSTNGGNSGLLAVYDIDTNTSTNVLVPNDFTETIGINRPIFATENKLWLVSKSSGTGNIRQYVREWDIDATGPAPTLTYVRELPVSTFSYPLESQSSRVISAISVVNDVLLLGFSTPSSAYKLIGVVTWDMPAPGTSPVLIARSTTNGQNGQVARSLSRLSIKNDSSYITELTSMYVTNSNNIILNVRFDIDPIQNQTDNVGNWVKQMSGIPAPNTSLDDSYVWMAQSGLSAPILLQEGGVPEFTTGWLATKAMPTWGVNGLFQVLQPETLVIYNISLSYPHTAIPLVSISDSDVWLSSAYPCANISLPSGDDNCTPTQLPQLTEGTLPDNTLTYLGPQTFEYYGQTVTASSIIWQGIAGKDDLNYNQTYYAYMTDCDVVMPGPIVPGDPSTSTVTFGRNQSGATLNNPAFDYTLTFENPIFNLIYRFSNLDGPSTTSTDSFRFTVNNGTPSITIIGGCNVELIGPNEFRTVAGTYNGDGSAEILVQSTEPFNIITLVGTNKGAGGPVALGCSGFQNNNCVWARPVRNLEAGINTVYKYNPLDNTYLPQYLVPGAQDAFDSTFVCSENTLFYLYRGAFNPELTYIQRYDISQDLLYIDEIQVTAPIGEFINPSVACVVDNNTLLLNSYELAVPTYTGKIWRLTINNDNTTELTFLFNLDTYRPYWNGPIFSNDKIIYVAQDNGDSGSIYTLEQRSYSSLDIELSTDLTYLNPAGTSPDGYLITNSNYNIFVFEDKMYLLVSGIKLYEIDTTFPYNTTLINANTAFYGEGQSNNQYLRAWSNAGQCNADLSFTPPPVSTTTTTTTLPDVNTIWMWFETETPQ